MTTPEPATSEGVFMKRTVEAAIRIGVIAGLIAWCFMIARPFLVPIIWGAVIAVAVFHGYDRLQTVLGGQRITAAVLITLLMLVLLVVPSVLLGDFLVSGAHKVMDFVQKGELHVPPPPESVAGWPLIGEPIAKTWTLASRRPGEGPAPGQSARGHYRRKRCGFDSGFGQRGMLCQCRGT